MEQQKIDNKVCTRKNPWTEDQDAGYWQHPDSVVRGQITYCSHCGLVLNGPIEHVGKTVKKKKQ